MSYFKEVIEKHQKNIEETTQKQMNDTINHEAKFNYIGRRCYKHISNILFNEDKLMRSIYYSYYPERSFSINHKCPYTGSFVRQDGYYLYRTCQAEIIKYINSQPKMQDNNVKMINIKYNVMYCSSMFAYN